MDTALGRLGGWAQGEGPAPAGLLQAALSSVAAPGRSLALGVGVTGCRELHREILPGPSVALVRVGVPGHRGEHLRGDSLWVWMRLLMGLGLQLCPIRLPEPLGLSLRGTGPRALVTLAVVWSRQ